METGISIVTVGHVDHGKSSVIGRLLADANVLPKGKMEAVKHNCELNARPFEYAFLLDALKCEQAQGITLDIARCFFTFNNHRFEILDAPGHLELLKNMVTGASRADAALLVIDAKRGVEENTRQHCYYLNLLGVKQLAVVVNKMDSVDFDMGRFLQIKEEMTSFLQSLSVIVDEYIPASCYTGDNIVSSFGNMPWYKGKTVIEQLTSFSCSLPTKELPLRLPLQAIYKFTEKNDTRRIFAGEVATGKVVQGDKLIFYPSGKRAVVQSLQAFPNTKSVFSAGQAAGLTVSPEIVVRRGELICKENEVQPILAVKIKANVFWLGEKELKVNSRYLLKICTAQTEATVLAVEKVFSPSTLTYNDVDTLAKNQVATVVFSLEKPIAFDLISEYNTNRFVLVDDFEISGGGRITEKLKDEAYDVKKLRRTAIGLSAIERSRFNLGKGYVFWLTGLSGSGKTTIGSAACYELAKLGLNTYLLDGDILRAGLCSDLGFSQNDRNTNITRAAYVAKSLKDAGIITIVSLISPYDSSRKKAKSIIGDDSYSIYVKAELETCRKRDPKQLYKAVSKGEIAQFTGYSSDYEIPNNPDLTIDTETLSEEEAAEKLVNFILTIIKKSE